jgi:hypothetical protein
VDQMHLQHLQPPVLPLPTHSSRKWPECTPTKVLPSEAAEVVATWNKTKPLLFNAKTLKEFKID